MSHSTDADEIKRIEGYWLDLLNLPDSCCGKTSHKKGTKSRKTRYEYGICSINISRAEIAHHIYGAIQEYVGFDNPDWLFY